MHYSTQDVIRIMAENRAAHSEAYRALMAASDYWYQEDAIAADLHDTVERRLHCDRALRTWLDRKEAAA